MVMFVNGIKNTQQQSCESSEALAALLSANAIANGRFNYTYFWNSTQGFFGDNQELLFQTAVSNRFLGQYSAGSSDYYKQMGVHYNGLRAGLSQLTDPVQSGVVYTAGQLKDRMAVLLQYNPGLIVVSHSQGNFYTEAAYAMLVDDGKTELLAKLKIVGVASLAATAPTPNKYVTQSLDKAIAWQALKLGSNPYYNPLTSNFTPCNIKDTCSGAVDVYKFDSDGHSFNDIYLNESILEASTGIALGDVVVNLVRTSIDELTQNAALSIPIIRDIWTASVYSYLPAGGGPGGGLDNDELRVGGWGDEYRSLLQFDISSASLPTQPASVILRLYNHAAQGIATTPMTLFRITQFWDWKTQGNGTDRLRLWWADQPSTVPTGANGTTHAATLPAPTVGAFYDIDVTDIYTFWKANPTMNFGLELRPTLTSNYWNVFASSENLTAAWRPQLIVVAGTPPPPPTGPQ